MPYTLTLDVPSTGYVGYEVPFKGKLTKDGEPVAGATIKILIMDEKGNVIDYTIATTDAAGNYFTKYVFTSTGTYLIKAVYEKPKIPEWAKYAAVAGAVAGAAGLIYVIVKKK